MLVRAVAAAPVPVVSGVGHEIDVTLCDLAADVRALTPTDAAVRIAPDGPQVTATLGGFAARLAAGLWWPNGPAGSTGSAGWPS
ncbi:MAG: hypothetical protein EBZ74_09670, partial [Planctomycetia bacterium]|nr:hypothetical protein [Planctomycetia bacterium]